MTHHIFSMFSSLVSRLSANQTYHALVISIKLGCFNISAAINCRPTVRYAEETNEHTTPKKVQRKSHENRKPIPPIPMSVTGIT